MLGARAAEKFGIPFTLSTTSILLDRRRGERRHQLRFQLYVFRDRGFAASLIHRAKAAKAPGADADAGTCRSRARTTWTWKNGLTVPPRLTASNFVDMLCKRSWTFNVLQSKRRSFGNLEGQIKGADNILTLSQWIAGKSIHALLEGHRLGEGALGRQADPEGILDAEDAKLAASTGADAIVVSNMAAGSSTAQCPRSARFPRCGRRRSRRSVFRWRRALAG